MNKKTAIITAISILTLGIIFVIARRSKAKKENEQGITSEFPLQIGSRGDNVKKLQSYLNTRIKTTKLIIDGIFGVLTQAALKSVTGKISITEQEFNSLIYKTT
jgi:peptidoglycan hydrolase-like protein with peptidoglycan-binding domain